MKTRQITPQLHKLLLKNDPLPCDCQACEVELIHNHNKSILFSASALLLCLLLAALMLVCFAGKAHAYTLDQWADAIKHAEGNSNYGILAHYKHTSYRQACKNTVRHSALKWARTGRKVPFLVFLQQRYCPIGSNTDNGTCKYWAKNVNYFLEKA